MRITWTAKYLEELRRCVPNLPAGPLSTVLPVRRIALCNLVVELEHVTNLVEWDGGVGRCEYSSLFGEISVVGVVQRVLDVVAYKHLDLGRRFGMGLERVRSDARKFQELLPWHLFFENLVIVIHFISELLLLDFWRSCEP